MNTGNQIFLFALRLMGYDDTEDLIENFVLSSIIDTFSRIKTKEHLEEKIRDLIVKDLENTNPKMTPMLKDKTFNLSPERWQNTPDEGKARTDLHFSMSGFEFVLECKTLKSAETKYLEKGLKRFIELRYAANDDFAGMLGFIIAGNPEEIVKKLKEKVKEFHPASNIEILLEKKCLEQELSFQSKHTRTNNTEIHIFHLFFDLRA